MTLALKHQRRQRLAQQHEAREANQYRELMTRAAKATKAIKSKSPLNVDRLTPTRQAEILAAYVDHLEAEAREFELTYPDKAGVRGARWIHMERSRAIDFLARLRVRIAKASYEPKKPELV